ncbi:MAG: TldD/PmbA family protein [Deltaproteobacteria bacterium]|nr:TldD/PmbA family protein [Deltaproteobacteria bacterium]
MRNDRFCQKILKTSLKNGGDFAEVFYEHVQPISIVCEDGKIEKIISGIDVGIGLRVIYSNKTAYAYTNQLTNEGLLEVADAVSTACQGKVFEKDISLVKKSAEIAHAIKRLPQEVSIDEKVSLVKRANDVARSWDKRIKQVKVVYADSVRSIAVANNAGDLTEDYRTATMFLVQIVATENDVIQTGYEPVGGVIGFELFDDNPPEKVAEIAGARAVRMLQARKAPGGTMPVVLSSEAGGTMIHEAIGHGLESDLTQMGLSVYSGRIGEEIASPLVDVVDDATLANKRGSYVFDDEGVNAQRTLLVEKGVLKGYLYDRLSAMKDHTQSTGNGRRESYRSRPIPRMSNTFILPGNMSPEEIVHSTAKGIFVKKMGGGQVNTVNGDFVFEVSEGYLIENGKVGEAVRGATLTGNGPQLLKEIDMVGDDFGFGIGTCGKDGQGVPVSDAQPTLRIPEIIVGGKV